MAARSTDWVAAIFWLSPLLYLALPEHYGRWLIVGWLAVWFALFAVLWAMDIFRGSGSRPGEHKGFQDDVGE